jgi:membrane associated rhomboid family serine protease
MDFYEQSSGRGMEIVVGLISVFVAIIFAALIWLVISNATIGYSPILGSLVLALCSFWFGKLGYRLVLNKPRKGGGLLSDNGLKLGCMFFGVSSILWGVFSISQQNLGSFLSAIGMLVACLYGWQIAKRRQSKET